MAEAMSEARLAEIRDEVTGPCSCCGYDKHDFDQPYALELLDEVDRLRAQLAEDGETREEFGVRVDGCTDTIGVYPGRESAEENLALWRKVWPSSEFTLMQRENRAAVVSGWREVPDA